MPDWNDIISAVSGFYPSANGDFSAEYREGYRDAANDIVNSILNLRKELEASNLFEVN